MEDKIMKIIADVLEIDPSAITADSMASDFEEWDSLALLSIIAELEEQLAITIPFDSALEIEGVRDILKYLK